MKAADIMNRYVLDVMEADDIYQAFSTLRQHHIHQLVVVDVDSQLRGVVYDRDLLRAWAEVSNSDRHFPQVASIMKRDVITCSPEDSLAQITAMMLEHRAHAMPVIDRKRRPVGIITTTDLLRFGLENLSFSRAKTRSAMV